MFTQSTFTPVSAHGNSDSPNSWSYRTVDNKAEVIAEDYFIDKYANLHHGDFIGIACADAIFSGVFIESQGKFTVADLNSGVAQLAVEQVSLGQFDSQATQVPTGLGQAGAIIINYGAGGSTSGGEFTVAPDGVITCNANSIQYDFELTLRLNRSTNPGVVRIVARLLYAPDGINFIQNGGTFGAEIDDSSTVWRESFSLKFSPEVGSKLKFELARDPSGNNSGGVGAFQPTGDIAGWSPISTASLDILKTITIVT